MQKKSQIFAITAASRAVGDTSLCNMIYQYTIFIIYSYMLFLPRGKVRLQLQSIYLGHKKSGCRSIGLRAHVNVTVPNLYGHLQVAATCHAACGSAVPATGAGRMRTQYCHHR